MKHYTPVFVTAILHREPGFDSLATCVLRAAEHYRRTYKAAATLCFVHPSALVSECVSGGVTVKPSAHVEPGNYWIGEARR